MLPAWISQHSAAALTIKSTVIPSLQQNLNECKFGLYPIITLASEDIYVGQNGARDGSFCPYISPQQKVTFIDLEKPP
jgi:hypothetical protein